MTIENATTSPPRQNVAESARSGAAGKSGSASGSDSDGPEGFLSLLTSIEPATEVAEPAWEPTNATSPLVNPAAQNDDPPNGAANDLALLILLGGQVMTKAVPAAEVVGAVPYGTNDAFAIGAKRLTVTPQAAFDGTTGSQNHLQASLSSGPVVAERDNLIQTPVPVGGDKSGFGLSKGHTNGSSDMSRTTSQIQNLSQLQETAAAKTVLTHPASNLLLREEPANAGGLMSIIGPKTSEASRMKDNFKSLASGLEGGWVAGGFNQMSQQVYGPTAVSAPIAAREIQEQLTYWVNHDLHNAEMKLDGPGRQPIEVSISIQGNEASIAFRTDQAEARDLLQSAVSQLEDMLSGQGLSLAGVSVGSSGQGQGHSGGDKHPGERRNTRITATVQPATAENKLVRESRNQGLDLFV